MQYPPAQSANAALAIALNLIDALKKKGLLDEAECLAVLVNSETDLQENMVSNIDARKAIAEIKQNRFSQSV